MNTKTLKNNAVTLLIGMVGASYVHADVTDNPEQLPSAGTAVDTFELSCPALTHNARAKVEDLTNEPDPNNTQALIFVTVIGPDDTASAAAATDQNPAPTGEGGGSSPWSPRVMAGSGLYDVTFEKITANGGLASGVEYYKGTALCYGPDNPIGNPVVYPQLSGESLD